MKNDYVTKSDLKEELGILRDDLKEFVADSIKSSMEDFAQIIGRSLVGMEGRMDIRFNDIEARMATKKDIMNLHDKFVPYYKFDELSLRVSKLEGNK
jgi:hypothetical protein